MQRLLMVAFIVMITMLLYPLLSFAGYIIHLKSGRQFVTERYWEEGGEIKFHFSRGVLGVPKEAVISIEEVIPETPAKETPPAVATPETPAKETPPAVATPEAPGKQESPPEAAPAEEKKEGKEVEEAVKKTEEKEEKEAEQTRPIHEYWEEKKALKVKLDVAFKRLREATKNKDAAGKKEAMEEVRKISKEIYRLTDEVKEINDGELPDYWWQD
jgi:outer membrane biosynthesis protein TonB